MSTLVTSTFGGVSWPEANYDNFARETYLKNIIAFRCIKMIAESVSSVEWELYKEDSDGGKEEIDNHEILYLLKRPNPDDSFNFLILKAISYFVMSGNMFFERVSTSSSGNSNIPKELFILRPDKMTININKITGQIDGYTFTNNGKSIFYERDRITGKCDILHVKTFHPCNDFWGAAITETAARDIDTSNAETEWNKKLLENECRPGMIISMEGNLTDSQFDRLEKQLKEKFSGASNAGKNLILEGEGKPDARPYGWSPTEMDFIEGGREKARRISYAYGVPPMLVGIPGDNTYSNQKEARLSFWEDTVFFYLNLLKGELNNWFFAENPDKYCLDYCVDEIPALAPNREKLWEKVKNSDWLTINEKREATGYDSVDNGDVIFVSASMLPLDMAGDTGNPDDGQAVADDETIKSLIKNGFSEHEAQEIIGMAPGDEKPYANEHACRLRDPKNYDSFARKNGAVTVDGKKVDFIYGIKNGKTELQAMRYKKSAWSADEARKHCNDHDPIEFEPAGK